VLLGGWQLHPQAARQLRLEHAKVAQDPFGLGGGRQSLDLYTSLRHEKPRLPQDEKERRKALLTVDDVKDLRRQRGVDLGTDRSTALEEDRGTQEGGRARTGRCSIQASVDVLEEPTDLVRAPREGSLVHGNVEALAGREKL